MVVGESPLFSAKERRRLVNERNAALIAARVFGAHKKT